MKNFAVTLLHSCTNATSPSMKAGVASEMICDLSNKLASHNIYHAVLYNKDIGEYIVLANYIYGRCHRDEANKQWFYTIYEIPNDNEDAHVISEKYYILDSNTKTTIFHLLQLINNLNKRDDEEDLDLEDAEDLWCREE